MKLILGLIFLQYGVINCVEIQREIEGMRSPVTFNCIGKSNEPGLCTPASECNGAKNNRRRNRQPICGKLETTEETVVCCNDINKYLQSKKDTVFYPDTSINEKKCDDYVWDKKRIEKIVELTKTHDYECNNGVCNYKSFFTIEAVGGVDAGLDEFPHMALLGWERTDSDEIDWNCGGTLISENFVLTAGHCVFKDDPSYKTPEPTFVKLGDSNPLQVKISSIITHPQYKPPSKYHDISLIELETPVTFYSDIRPACLSTRTNLRGSATMVGWGAIDSEGTRPQRLQKVNLDIYNKKTCEKLYNTSRTLPRGIADTQFCAGSLQGGKDACQGDSGGPIQIPNKRDQGVFDVIGIVSFGRECGSKNGGVYTKVAAYDGWIERIVWPLN